MITEGKFRCYSICQVVKSDIDIKWKMPVNAGIFCLVEIRLKALLRQHRKLKLQRLKIADEFVYKKLPPFYIG
jgi:hypothetical protein